LTSYEKVGPESMQGWLSQNWWLTAMPQVLTQFRKSAPSIRLILVFQDDGLEFMERDNNGEIRKVESIYNIKHQEKIDKTVKNRLWLERDYCSLLEEFEDKYGISMRSASFKYGEISFPDYGANQNRYLYSDQFGLKEIRE